MTGTLPKMVVEIDVGPSDDAEYMARLTYRLRDELLNLDVDDVQIAANDEVPENAKAIGLVAAGGLVVRFIGHEVLESIIDRVRSWLARQHCRSIKLTLDGDTLELTGVSSAEQNRLVDLWVTRHAGAG